MQFEYYVLNENFNRTEIIMFNVFKNGYVQQASEKAIKKYLKSPKKFEFKPYSHNDETLYGWDAFVATIDGIIKHEEWARCEYEVLVGSLFIVEARAVLKDILEKNVEDMIPRSVIEEKLNNRKIQNDILHKIDCYSQCKPNMQMICHEIIRQYKEQFKQERENKKLGTGKIDK